MQEYAHTVIAANMQHISSARQDWWSVVLFTGILASVLSFLRPMDFQLSPNIMRQVSQAVITVLLGVIELVSNKDTQEVFHT